MLNRIAAAAILATLVAATGQLPAAAQPSVSIDRVCAEHDDGGTCLWWLDVAFQGDSLTMTAGVAGGATVQIWCDRGHHFDPDGGLGSLGQHRLIRCEHPEYGWYSQTYDCYFTGSNLTSESPGVILPPGYQPGDPGAVYRGMCLSTSDSGEYESDYDWVWARWFGGGHYRFLESPDRAEGIPDPVPELVVRAVTEMAMQAPTIGTAPPATQGAGLVNLPVWLWNEVNGNNWGGLSTTTPEIAGISVVAQAEADRIDWDLGNGDSRRCDEGVAWQRGMDVMQPACGYTYRRSSRGQPGGGYQIEATTTWQVEWWTEGLTEQRSGQFELQPTNATTLAIDEIQVLYG